MSHPLTTPLDPDARQAVAARVEDLMARVQSGCVEPTQALAVLADISRPAGTALANLRTVARAIAVMRDAGEVGDGQVVQALAGQYVVAAMLIDADDPLGTGAVFCRALHEGVVRGGAAVLDGVCGDLAGAVATGRGELRLDQAAFALATFAQLERPDCLEEAAQALVRLPLSDRTVVHILRRAILDGPAEHRPAAGALLVSFARERAMFEARLLAALADPDPRAAIRLLVALLGQNDPATANPRRPPLGWDVMAVGLHWLMAEGIGADQLMTLLAEETAALPHDLAAMLNGMARKIAWPSRRPAAVPWHPDGWFGSRA